MGYQESSDVYVSPEAAERGRRELEALQAACVHPQVIDLPMPKGKVFLCLECMRRSTKPFGTLVGD